MENIGISTAPSGIGSGEAQIIGFDKTMSAVASKAKAEAAAAKVLRDEQKKRDEAFAKEVASIDINKTHIKDRPDLMNEMQGIKNLHSKTKTATTNTERMDAEIELEKQKKGFMYKVAKSQEYANVLAEGGKIIVTTPRDEMEDGVEEMWNGYKNMKSWDAGDVDIMKFKRKEKPVDVGKIDSDIANRVTYEFDDMKPRVGKVGSTEIIYNVTGDRFDANKFVEGVKDSYLNSSSYKKQFQRQYEDAYLKSEQYKIDKQNNIDEENGLFNFGVLDKVDTYRKLKEISKLKYSRGAEGTPSYSIQPIGYIKALGDGNIPKVGDDVYQTTQEQVVDKKKVEYKTIISTPTIDKVPINGTMDGAIEGYFGEDGKWNSGKRNFVNASLVDFVSKPVYVNLDENKTPSLFAEDIVTTDPAGKEIRKTSTTNLSEANNLQIVKFAKIMDNTTKKSYLVELDKIPANVRNKPDIIKNTQSFMQTDGNTTIQKNAQGTGYSASEEAGIQAFMEAKNLTRKEAINQLIIGKKIKKL
jgi:hypothetical protein